MNELELVLAMEAADHASPAIRQAARAILFYGDSFEKAKKQAQGAQRSFDPGQITQGVRVASQSLSSLTAVFGGLGGVLGGLAGSIGRVSGLFGTMAGGIGAVTAVAPEFAVIIGVAAAAIVSLAAAFKALQVGLTAGPRLLVAFTKALYNVVTVATRAATRFLALNAALGATVLAVNSIAFTGLAAGIGFATKQASALEFSLARIRGVTGDSKQVIEDLGRTFRELAKTSTFTAAQFAEAGFYMASAGFSSAQIKRSIEGIVKLAEALRVDLAQAAEVTMAVLAAYKMEMEDSTRVANVLAAANAESMATFEKLSEALKYVAPVAGTLNLRFEETVAALNLLYNTGLQGSQAGVYLRGVLMQLIRPTSQATQMLREHGLTVRDISPAYHDLATILERLSAANLTAAETSMLFGARAGTAAMTLLRYGAPALREMEKAITGTNQAFTQAEIQLDTLSGAVKYFLSSAEELSHVLTGGVVTPLKETVQVAAEFVNWLSQQQGIRDLGRLLTSIAQDMRDFAEDVLDRVKANWETLWRTAYTVFTWWFTNVSAGVSAIVALFRYLAQTFGEYGEALRQIWVGIAHVWSSALAIIAHVLLTVESMIRDFATKSDAWEALQQVAFETTRSIVIIFAHMGRQVLTTFFKMVSALAAVWMVLSPSKIDPISIALNSAVLSIGAMTAGLYALERGARAVSFEGFQQLAGVVKPTERLGKAIRGLMPEDILRHWDKTADAAKQFRQNVEGMLTGGPVAVGGGQGLLGGALGAIGTGWQRGREWAQSILSQARGAAVTAETPETREAVEAAKATTESVQGMGEAVSAAEEQTLALERAATSLSERIQRAGDDIEMMSEVARDYTHLEESASEAAKQWGDIIRDTQDQWNTYIDNLRSYSDRLGDSFAELSQDIRDTAQAQRKYWQELEHTLQQWSEFRQGMLPLGEAQRYAVAERARQLAETLTPRQLARILPGALAMGREERAAAAERSPRLLRMAMTEVRRMSIGEIQRLAEQRIDRTAQAYLQYYREYVRPKKEAEITVWEATALRKLDDRLKSIQDNIADVERQRDSVLNWLKSRQQRAEGVAEEARYMLRYISDISQQAQARGQAWPVAAEEWQGLRQQAYQRTMGLYPRTATGQPVMQSTPASAAEQRLMQIGNQIGAQLIEAFRMGRQEERRSQTMDLTTGEAE